MLVIRLKRMGRSGHAQYRVVVQDSRHHPTSGRVVAYAGSFNPHSKTAQLQNEKLDFYLEHGAQPSPRVARLLKSEGIKLPKWVEIEKSSKRSIKNPEKLRKNRPAEPAADEKPAKSEPTNEEAAAKEPETEEKPAEEQKTVEEAPSDEAEKPAEVKAEK